MGIGINVLWVERLAYKITKNINLFVWFPKSFASQWNSTQDISKPTKLKLRVSYEHLKISPQI